MNREKQKQALKKAGYKVPVTFETRVTRELKLTSGTVALKPGAAVLCERSGGGRLLYVYERVKSGERGGLLFTFQTDKEAAEHLERVK